MREVQVVRGGQDADGAGFDPAARHLGGGGRDRGVFPRKGVQPGGQAGLVAQHRPADWQDRYRYAPVLLETFVDTNRFTGASYQAAGWTWADYTKGRGKLDRGHRHAQPVKDVYLYPLRPDYRRILTSR